MNKRLLTLMLCLAATPLHAFNTTEVPCAILIDLGHTLSQRAGSSQWQQLWQRVRKAGYLSPGNTSLRFEVPSALLPALAQQTLARADHVRPVFETQAVYRRTFDDRIIGFRNGQPLHALCVQVDWRSVPAELRSLQDAYVGSASLLSAYPCD
ncbi:hypothetical protein [Pseudomonas putida]|uniref:hypothetical protein n=1 Tax=Pseudomonas putida TaxID=303 RepID=UPI0018A8DA5A|nr:hypothetical protein [Pseudomonas putida]MBF8728394.1 hypothetical protein [Pseudomonas putida]